MKARACTTEEQSSIPLLSKYELSAGVNPRSEAPHVFAPWLSVNKRF
jgi:hypothetical protein